MDGISPKLTQTTKIIIIIAIITIIFLAFLDFIFDLVDAGADASTGGIAGLVTSQPDIATDIILEILQLFILLALAIIIPENIDVPSHWFTTTLLFVLPLLGFLLSIPGVFLPYYDIFETVFEGFSEIIETIIIVYPLSYILYYH